MIHDRQNRILNSSFFQNLKFYNDDHKLLNHLLND